MSPIRLLKNGSEAFPAMFGAIDRAAASVALEMYVIKDDATGRELREHLVNAAKRCIPVLVLADAWGSVNLQDSFWDELRSAGGAVRWFHPLLKGLIPFRNHRKLLLIDDALAFLGGINIADEYYRGSGNEPPWRDNVLEISGTEAARLRRSFARMWSRAGSPYRRWFLRLGRYHRVKDLDGGRVRFLESGPENPMRQVRRAYRQLIQDAERSIDLAMGYFYPHGSMLRTLKRAAKRGVPVRLLFSQKTDVPIARWAARGLYGRLLHAGIEVWEYKPAMLHAKLAVVDDTVVAGSANLDIRSGRINYELVVVVTDRELASRARADFEEDLKDAGRIELEEWRGRPLMQKIKERISYWLLARADILVARWEMNRRMRREKGR